MAKMSTCKTRAALTGALFFFACMIQSAFAGALPRQGNASLRSSRQTHTELPPTLDYGTTDPMMLEGEMGTEMAEDLPTSSPVPRLEEQVIKEEADATTQSGMMSPRKKSRSVRFPHKKLMNNYTLALTAGLLTAAAAGLGTAWYKKGRKEQPTVVPAVAEELAEREEPESRLVDRPADRFLGRHLTRAAMLSAGLAVAAGLYFLYTKSEDIEGLGGLFTFLTEPANATLGAQKTEKPDPLKNVTAKNKV